MLHIIIKFIIAYVIMKIGYTIIDFSDKKLWKPGGSILRDIVAFIGFIILLFSIFFVFMW